jgi:hypothetical protein
MLPRPLTILLCMPSYALIRCIAWSLVSAASVTAAEPVGVLTVTDMTPAGRERPTASPEQPVYYQGVSVGFQSFARAIAGDREPPNDQFLQLVLRTLKEQGYVPSSDQHPPTLVLGFAWGYLSGNFGGALKFLGGDKLDLLWETEQFGRIDPRALTRGMRSPMAERVVEMANEPLYVVTIVAYDWQDAINGKLSELWQTRIACPARGNWAMNALPQIVRAAGPSIGRETARPEWLSPEETRRRATVDIGELTTVDMSTAPVLDMKKEKMVSER